MSSVVSGSRYCSEEVAHAGGPQGGRGGMLPASLDQNQPPGSYVLSSWSATYPITRLVGTRHPSFTRSLVQCPQLPNNHSFSLTTMCIPASCALIQVVLGSFLNEVSLWGASMLFQSLLVTTTPSDVTVTKSTTTTGDTKSTTLAFVMHCKN